MSLVKMECGVNYTTEVLKDNVNGLIERANIGKRVFPASDTPTVTFATGSTITGGIRQYPALTSDGVATFSDSAFSYLGVRDGDLIKGPSDSITGDLFFNADVSSTTGYWIPSVSFDYSGSEVEIQLRAKSAAGAKYRVEINGTPLTSDFTSVTVSSGNYYSLKLSFVDSRLRNIRVSAYKLDFGGVITQSFCRAVKPYIHKKPKVAVLSNSICAGYSNDTFRWQSWPAVLSEMLGFDVYNVSIGSTGYLSDKPPTYQSRVVDIIGVDPDIIIFGDHYNDLGSTEVDIKAAMDLLVATLKTQFPNAILMMLGGWCTDELVNDKQISLDQYVRDLCAANDMIPIMYTNPYGNWDAIPAWITATSYIQGEQVRYRGVVWECIADHASSGTTINTFGFRASTIVTSANKSTTLLPDLLHPTELTYRSIGSAIAQSISS